MSVCDSMPSGPGPAMPSQWARGHNLCSRSNLRGTRATRAPAVGSVTTPGELSDDACAGARCISCDPRRASDRARRSALRFVGVPPACRGGRLLDQADHVNVAAKHDNHHGHDRRGDNGAPDHDQSGACHADDQAPDDHRRLGSAAPRDGPPCDGPPATDPPPTVTIVPPPTESSPPPESPPLSG